MEMKLFQALRNVERFRTAFDFGGREVAHWFPGHMAKGDTLVHGFLLAYSQIVLWFSWFTSINTFYYYYSWIDYLL